MKANIMGKKHNYVKTKFYCRSRSNLSEGENQNVIYHLTSGSDKKKVMILFKCCFLGG